MRVHAVAHAAELEALELAGWTVIVIDAIRASSTIAQGVANGCARVIPVATVDEALARKATYPTGDVLLCGERQSVKIPGFDLGNSPREFTKDAVSGKTLVFTTTNGTRAIAAARTAHEVIIGAFVNLPSVVEYLRGQKADVLVVPVGREDAPVLDDVVCAGMYVDRLIEGISPSSEINASAALARMAYLGYRDRLLDAALDSPSGKNLVRVGLGDDLPHVTQVGILNVVPKVVNGVILGSAT